jgi:hypothetical protein
MSEPFRGLSTYEGMRIQAPGIGFEGLDELATRLAVAPRGKGGSRLVTVIGKSGVAYDLIELVHALLNRLENTTKEGSP